MHEPSDAEVAAFVHAHPEGASAQEIADLLGVTRQRIDQFVNRAVKKLQRVVIVRYRLTVADITLEHTCSQSERLESYGSPFR